MDVRSGTGYPSSALSNFSPYKFEIDGIQCNSMEGFLQSLKFRNPEIQKEICKLIGRAAKRKGSGKNWKKYQELYWNGVKYSRDGDLYQKLLDKAYDCLFKNEKFRKALYATRDYPLTHNLGKSKKCDTVLTKSEFIFRLINLRKRLYEGKRYGD